MQGERLLRSRLDKLPGKPSRVGKRRRLGGVRFAGKRAQGLYQEMGCMCVC